MLNFADRDVSLGDLEAVLAVSECGQFSRAGEVLRRPQPAVSRAVQDVESSVRTKLFNRDSRPVLHTPAGDDFLYELRKAFHFLERAFAAVRTNARAASSALEVGHSVYFDPALLTYLAHVNKLPDAGFSAIYHSSFSTEIVANILAGVWDCGFVLKPAESQGLESIPVMRDQLGLVMPNDHPLARQRSVCLRDMGNERLILPMGNRNPTFHAWFLEHCAAAGFDPKVVQEISHPHEAVVFAGQRVGVALATRATARRTRDNATVFRPFADEKLAMEIQLAMRSGSASTALQAFIAAVLKMKDRMAQKTTAPREPLSKRRIA
jgi:DNA-binding transcriptional LysR family regulator